MTNDRNRYPKAVEREAAKLAGVDDPPHPADKHGDPLTARLADLPEDARKPKLKHLGGSKSDRFNIDIVNAVFAASWITSKEDQDRLVMDVGHALAGINPQTEVEGMLAAQMVAAHQAAMECFRRGMLHEQTLDGRALNLNQANKASRTYAMLLEALDRHRGKSGHQKVTVEHVHVYPGGQAIVGSVEGERGGSIIENREQSYAQRALAHAPESPLRSQDQEREPVPRASDGERPMPDARRREPGSTER